MVSETSARSNYYELAFAETCMQGKGTEYCYAMVCKQKLTPM